jgi:hypothetical protein
MTPRFSTAITLSVGLIAGYVLAAAPNYAALKSLAAPEVSKTAGAQPEMLAQAAPGLDAQELQLLQQIEGDSAKLRADEAAEKVNPRGINPQRKWIRAALNYLGDAANALQHTTHHYSGRRADALKAMVEAHHNLMACYRIDSGS